MGMIRCKYCGYISWDLLEYVEHIRRHGERDEGFQEYRDSSSQTPQMEADEYGE